MINCIIVDDEPLAQDLLEEYVKKVPFLNLITRCSNAMEANQAVQNNKVDLLFLDIQMPDLTGLEFIATLPQPPMVIFTTAYDEYAVKGYDVNAVDYLLKPIAFERFLKACNKALNLHTPKQAPQTITTSKKEPGYLFIKSEYKLIKVNTADILYIEGLKDYIVIKTATDKILSLQSLKKIEEMLPDNNFTRVHKSYIVAIDKIDEIERNLIIIGKKTIPVGASYKEYFQKVIEGRKL